MLMNFWELGLGLYGQRQYVLSAFHLSAQQECRQRWPADKKWMFLHQWGKGDLLENKLNSLKK